MRLGRSLVGGTLLASIFILGNAGRAEAQQPPPDLRMLLDLDLFASPSGTTSITRGKPARNDSMLDQIRTLDRLGYLGATPDNRDDSATQSGHDAAKFRNRRWQGFEVQP